ncbi:MAG TPA: hypothetical protein VM287_01465 [Egibacteraceae bacterium]|nr:hypothetical protein [Egibacteraceae bacterium]
MTVATPSAINRSGQRPAQTSARPTVGERFRAAGRRFVTGRETAVHEDMIAGRYGPEAAAARRSVRTDAAD